MSSSYQDTIPKSFHSEQPKRQLSEKSGGQDEGAYGLFTMGALSVSIILIIIIDNKYTDCLRKFSNILNSAFYFFFFRKTSFKQDFCKSENYYKLVRWKDYPYLNKCCQFQDEVMDVEEVNKRNLGKMIVRYIGHERIVEKSGLRRFLQACIDFL